MTGVWTVKKTTTNLNESLTGLFVPDLSATGRRNNLVAAGKKRLILHRPADCRLIKEVESLRRSKPGRSTWSLAGSKLLEGPTSCYTYFGLYFSVLTIKGTRYLLVYPVSLHLSKIVAKKKDCV